MDDAHTWIIHQLEYGAAEGWWTAQYAEQMTKDSGVLSRSKSKSHTQKEESAIQWITKALTYGVAEGWYSQCKVNEMLSKADIAHLFAADLVGPDPGINWRWLNA